VLQSVQVGLLRKVHNNYYDTFQDRVIFPIQNQFGEILGFGGRKLEEGNKDYPKYLNSPETPIYKKSNVLYGLNFAAQAIYKSGEAYLTEGYADVIAMHELGMINTTATCGTALTEAQVIQLKKIKCEKVILLRDGDQAGQKAAKRDLEMLLPHTINVEMVILQENEDPYDLMHSNTVEDPVVWIEEHRNDALTHFCKDIARDAGSPHAKLQAIKEVARLLSLIPNEILRDSYRTDIATATKFKVKNLKEAESGIVVNTDNNESQNTNYNLPEGVDKDEAYRNGFYPILDEEIKDPRFNKTGYYFIEDKVMVTNFILTPLFHNPDIENNTRILKIEDGILKPKIIEMPSSALLSVEKFRAFIFDNGPYRFIGSKIHLDKIVGKLMYKFPTAWELRTLGWQREGFFSFYNCIYNGTLKEYDYAGLVEHKNKFYFSPAASEIYADIRKESDEFENDRYLSYIKSPISFNKWMDLMVQVYGEHAYAAIPFVFVSLFRDVVFSVDNNCPHLYGYGQSRAGKSKYAESLMNLFFKEMPAFNLNSGTDFAFANRLERYRNVPVFLNEFDDNVVKDEWFQSIKGAYDGEGRERGKGGSKRKTETQKVNSTLILIGQYLSTKDDNSVLSRCIMRQFKLVSDRSEAQIKAYDELKTKEKLGLSSLVTDILPYREMVEKKYYTEFNSIFKLITQKIRYRKEKYEERVVRNYTSMITMVYLFQDEFKFPWSMDEYVNWAIEEIIGLSSLISESDILMNFWTVISNLAIHQYDVAELVHYKIVKTKSIRVHNKKRESKTISLGEEEKEVLYIRLKDVHLTYKQAKKKMGENAIDWASLQTYIMNREYYLGKIDSVRIGKHMVIAYIFDYKALNEAGIHLANEKGDDPYSENTQ
jgi:5S rRNA maturation endonuclease (ribonuclease M5)